MKLCARKLKLAILASIVLQLTHLFWYSSSQSGSANNGEMVKVAQQAKFGRNLSSNRRICKPEILQPAQLSKLTWYTATQIAKVNLQTQFFQVLKQAKFGWDASTVTKELKEGSFQIGQ